MVNCKVHIQSNIGWDENIFVKIDLPAIPRRGDRLILRPDVLIRLEEQAKKSLETASRYAPDFFYGFSTGSEPGDLTLKSIEDLNFAAACFVKTVEFVSNSLVVNIMLDRWEPEMNL